MRVDKETAARGGEEIRALGGEFALIERIMRGGGSDRSAFGENLLVGIGDDAAVLKTPGSGGGSVSVVTTDMMLEDVHFRRAWADPYRLGWKAVAINISDIAAMGAEPTFTFVSLALPTAITVDFVDDLYHGMRDVCAAFGAAIAGGDTNLSPDRMVINVTQLGTAKKKRVALRSEARPGDAVLVTGTLGNAAAGLALLEAHGRDRAEAISPLAVAAQLAPMPRVHEARAGVHERGITAMMDVSDGLLGDLHKLCRASGVGAVVREKTVPVGEGARQAAAFLPGEEAIHWALYGGEDYELLLTASPERAERIRAAITEATGTPVSIIGEITGDEAVIIERAADGAREPVRRGWDHFLADAASRTGTPA